MNRNNYSPGYVISVAGVVIALLWIGLFKFTSAEAAAIRPLVENHFAMSWMYAVLSEQGVSNVIGTTEIAIAAGLILSFRVPEVGKYAGGFSALIFVSTLSFLITTPGISSTVEGFPVTDFFILKDIVLLGASITVWEHSRRRSKEKRHKV